MLFFLSSGFSRFHKLCSPFRAVFAVSGGLLLVLKFSSLFRAICSLFSISSFFERFAPCSQLLWFLSSGLPLVLKLSSLFRAVCSMFSFSSLFCAVNFSKSLSRSLLPVFMQILVDSFFEQFTLFSQVLKSLSSGALRVFKFSSLTFSGLLLVLKLRGSSLGAVSSLFSKSPVSCERLFSLFSNSVVVFERFSPACSNFLVPFERFAACSQIRQSFSICQLLVFKFSSVVRAFCYLFSSSQAFPERLAPGFQIFSLFRAVCPLFTNALVSLERVAPCAA